MIVASDELRPFFAAILAAPEDDAPRLELARLLSERGDQRGEYIRLSCELDRLEMDDPALTTIAVREGLEHPIAAARASVVV